CPVRHEVHIPSGSPLLLPPSPTPTDDAIQNRGQGEATARSIHPGETTGGDQKQDRAPPGEEVTGDRQHA
ncbi:hypothetical protein M8J76_004185, partial [Diaphorina citri]